MPRADLKYARSAAATRDQACGTCRPAPPKARKSAQNILFAALVDDSAVTGGSHLTTFLRAEHAGEMTVTDVGETDFAVIVYREEELWEADVLPTAVTADLDGLLQALRRQPSTGGTIGFAGVGDDFFVAIMVFG